MSEKLDASNFRYVMYSNTKKTIKIEFQLNHFPEDEEVFALGDEIFGEDGYEWEDIDAADFERDDNILYRTITNKEELIQYIVFEVDTNYCGTDQEVFEKFVPPLTDDELDDWAEQLRTEHGHQYTYMINGYGEEYTEEEEDEFFEGCTCMWRTISKEEYYNKETEG